MEKQHLLWAFVGLIALVALGSLQAPTTNMQGAATGTQCGDGVRQSFEECDPADPVSSRIGNGYCGPECTVICNPGYEYDGNTCVPTSQCVTDADCHSGHACAIDRCVEGQCIQEPVEPYCPPPSRVPCGDPIEPINGCGECDGHGTRCEADSRCLGDGKEFYCVPENIIIKGY